MMDVRLKNKNDPERIIQVTYPHYKEVIEPQRQWIPIDADGNEIVVDDELSPEQTKIKELQEEIESLRQALAQTKSRKKKTEE